MNFRTVVFPLVFGLALLAAPQVAADPALTAPPGTGSIATTAPIFQITPQMFGAACDGTTNDRAAFHDADSKGGSLGPLYIAGGECRIGSNLTITTPIEFGPGGELKPDNGVTVTINAPVQRPRARIFDLSAGGLVRGDMRFDEVWPENWGAKGDGTNVADATYKGLQAAIDYVIATDPGTGISLEGGRTWEIGNHGLIATSNTCIKLFGNGTGPDNTRLQNAPLTATPIITFDSSAASGAPCSGGLSDVYLDGNSNTIGVKLLSQGFSTIRIGMSQNIGLGVWGCSCTLYGHVESNRIKIVAPNLGPSQQALKFTQSAGGTGSFAGNVIEDGTQISTTGSARSTALFEFANGAFFYNGEFNVLINNIGGSVGNPVNLIKNAQSAALTLAGGAIRAETTNDRPINIVDPNGSVVYFGGSLSSMGPYLSGGLRIDKLVRGAIISYEPGGRVNVIGGNVVGQNGYFTGTAGITLNSHLMQNVRTFVAAIYNAANTWNYTFKFDVITETSGPGNCTIANYSYVPTLDNGWGPPPAPTCAGFMPRFTHPSWPSTVDGMRWSLDTSSE